MTKCAFGNILLRGTFEPQFPFGTELYGRMLYLCNEDTQVLMIAMDTCCTGARFSKRFTELVSDATGIPGDNIWFHELQIHAAPFSPEMVDGVIDSMAARTIDEVKRMQKDARPFTCVVAEADAGTRYTMNREQYVDELGGVTIYAGIRFDKDGVPYCQDSSRMNLWDDFTFIWPDLKEPVYFDNTVDSKAYLFVFYDEEGKVMGTMSRFAAHPDVAVLFESHVLPEFPYHYHFDWPGYLSKKLEAYFGAPTLYINGPCGDLATQKAWDNTDTYEASDAECRRIGEGIAQLLIDRFNKKTVSLGDHNHLRALRFETEVPMRDNYPHSVAEAEDREQALDDALKVLKTAAAEGQPLSRLKRLGDDCIRASHDKVTCLGECMFTDEDLRRHTAKPLISAIQLGDYTFIGVPGESLVDMTMWLRSSFTGVKTIPVDQVNGYFSYMATPRSLTLGGYTYWASWTSRRTIPLLKEQILEKLGPWMEEE